MHGPPRFRLDGQNFLDHVNRLVGLAKILGPDGFCLEKEIELFVVLSCESNLCTKNLDQGSPLLRGPVNGVQGVDRLPVFSILGEHHLKMAL